MIARISGINEKRRSLRRVPLMVILDNKSSRAHPMVSDQVGTVPASHIKLPTNAHMAEMNSVTGMNAEVASKTGLTNTPCNKRSLSSVSCADGHECYTLTSSNICA